MRRAVVVGGGLAALAAAVDLAERRIAVDLVSAVDPGRSALPNEGGLSAGSDADALYHDTIAGGDYLAPRSAVRAMADGAAAVVHRLGRLGVPFQRERGALALRRLDGRRAEDAVFVAGRTAQQIARVLVIELARLEADGRVRVHEPCELVEIVCRDGRAVGCVAQDLVTMSMHPFEADAIVLAAATPPSWGLGPRRQGDPVAAAVRAGCVHANAELLQLHPAAIARDGRRFLVSSAFRAEGGRFWVPEDEHEAREPRDVPKRQRLRVLAERHPDLGELAPDDLAARELQRVIVSLGRGVYDRRERKNKPVAYLDLTHLPAERLEERLGGELEACARVGAVDPARTPLLVEPTIAGSLGGLWVDHAAGTPRDHATSIEGLYAAGEAACLYHGACRLGGNVLLADLFGAERAAAAVAVFVANAPTVESNGEVAGAAERAETAVRRRLEQADGERARDVHDELASVLDRALGFERDAAGLDRALGALPELGERAAAAVVDDASGHAGRGPSELRALDDALLLGELALRGARARGESRGVHHRAGATRDDLDARFTLACLTGEMVELVDAFEQRLLGERHRIAATVDPGDVPPAPRGQARAEKPA